MISTIKLVRQNDNFNKIIDKRFPVNEFHIAKDVREKYNFEERIFASNGNVVLADFGSVRKFTELLNSKRELSLHVTPGHVNAMGLLDEIYHFLIREYETSKNPGVMKKALNLLSEKYGKNKMQALIEEFAELFPPTEVYKERLTLTDYFKGYHEGRSNYEVELEEMILNHFTNLNPANNKLKELFDESYFKDQPLYKSVIKDLDAFFREEEKFGPDNQDLFDMFKMPFTLSPDNLEWQLDYIMQKWRIVIKDFFSRRILTGKDLMREDFMFAGFGGGGEAPSVAPNYKGKVDLADVLTLGKSQYKYAEDAEKDYDEPEQFTPDSNWMPSVVLIAKNTYVWLDQLSKKYGKHIHRLDQIPDEELDMLARWNFTGLWLIGLWERSNASKKIKHILGNIDAVSSAYSLYDYTIAADLGGEEAYAVLNEKAKKRGIRLASDMVPNHTGIFSKWVLDNPDYFVQRRESPFPSYSFNGPDLSDDPNIELKIEDGYYSYSDAAVVFRRIDKRYNDVRYIYHGNDGTSMPWNDTAQLDMLKAEVREAVIQKIFDVARRFSIIRFDAAMTLAKRHFSRLWYPQPGRGGDIPSRSDNSMTKEEFNSWFPVEFWREVVDRINEEMPDTLLLAEAFWLMEGYFVRTLGMHRVYNSAFMNMLMREENDKYRDLITNTLEFEPEILKRYVNFMSNPDEETAIKQFGSDDKYFGSLILMITLPGLPMFAHGQIEGFTEKYGMEYKRAYYNETPNQWLIERHEREIFPLTQKRHLFSQVYDFWIFDFMDNYGSVNENVFAYVNKAYGEKALVFYNNKYDDAKGKIKDSTPKLVTRRSGKNLETRSVTEALEIKADYGLFYIYRDLITDREYIRSGKDLCDNGFYMELGAFKYAVFLDFREVYDHDGRYYNLYNTIGYSSVYRVERAVKEMVLSPVHNSFEKIFEENAIDILIDEYIKADSTEDDESVASETKSKFFFNKYHYLLNLIKKHIGLERYVRDEVQELKTFMSSAKAINNMLDLESADISKYDYKIIEKAFLLSSENNYNDNSIVFMLWSVMRGINKVCAEKDFDLSGLLLEKPASVILKKLGKGEAEIKKDINLLKIVLEYDEHIFASSGKAFEKLTSSKKDIKEYLATQKLGLIERLIKDDYVKKFIGYNYYEGVWYYSKELLEELLNWMFTLIAIEYFADVKLNYTGKSKTEISESNAAFEENLKKLAHLVNYVKELSGQSGYKFEVLKQSFNSSIKAIVKPEVNETDDIADMKITSSKVKKDKKEKE